MAIEDDDDVESCGSRAVESYSATANPSARNHHQRQKLEVYNEVLKRIQDSNFEEANVPGFDDHLWLHFNRLPARYVMDVNVERAEDVLMHKRLLQLAEDPANRPAFEVHLVQVYPSWNGNSSHPGHSDPAMKEDAQSSYFTNKQGMLPPPTFGSTPHLEAFQAFRYNVEDGDGAINSTPCRSRPMHEITFSTVDRPKLLSQLTSLLAEIGLNIQEAHAFSTVDGFSLDVFVVDGWLCEETEELKNALEREILKAKGGDQSSKLELIMIKRSPSRNARSKGIKAKHVLQICLLLGVCFWLLYQVKHSHDKKKELEEKDASFSQKTLSHEVLPKLGRKDPHPGLQDKTSEKNEEEEEEETGVDEEGNKKEENGHEKDDEEEGGQEGGGTKDEEVEREEQRMHEEEEKGGEVTDHLEKEKEEQIEHEEDEQNEEANSNETNDEDRKVGDDEVDERDREKIEGEADPDGEFMDEEKEREDDGEKKESQGNEGEGKEIQGNEDEDREVQTDHETQSDGQDHDGSGKNSHVAREEHYMADDASSAVTHDTQIISTEQEKQGLEKSNEKLAADDLQQDKYSINDNPLDVNGDKNNSTSQLEQAGNGHSLNATADEKKNDVTSPSMSEEGSPNNSTVTPNITTVTVLSSDQSVSSNKSTEVSSEAGDNQVSENLEVPGTSQQNGMLNVSESTQIRNATVDGQVTGDIANLQTTQSEQVNNGINSESIQSDSNSTLLGQTEKADSFGNDSSNSSSNSESGGSGKTIEKPEVTATEDVNSGFSSGTNETKEATHDENSDTIHESGGRDENTDSTTNETVDAVIHDPNDSSDSSIGQDEKEARIDLDTLPEFGTGRVDNGNVAEE